MEINYVKTEENKFLSKQKNMCLTALNDKLNCQVSTIFMNPRSIDVETRRE
jgi:hypothetical protein